MTRLAPLALVAVAAAACAPFRGPAADAPLCGLPETNIYVDQGGTAPCRLQVGQRYVVKMPRTSSDEALRNVCFGTYHGEAFIDDNLGGFVYCVLARRAA